MMYTFPSQSNFCDVYLPCLVIYAYVQGVKKPLRLSLSQLYISKIALNTLNQTKVCGKLRLLILNGEGYATSSTLNVSKNYLKNIKKLSFFAK